MKLHLSLICTAWLLATPAPALSETEQTPYQEQKVVYDFYFDEPGKIATALYWLRAHLNTLNAEPYNLAPDFNEVKVIIHGTEIVTVARKNYEKYREIVERMKYYSELGVEFKVCALAAQDFDYLATDFHDFIQVIPNAQAELVHWQMQGYGLITPQVNYKRYSIEDIR